MKKYLLLPVFILATHLVMGQCLVNSLIINTGYDPITGNAIAGGLNGGTPVTDPHWMVTAITPTVATAILGTPILGLIEVVPVSNADVVTPVGGWVTNPPGNPGGWITCLNSNTYTTNGTGVIYQMTLSRPFRMCTADSIVLDFYIANDNYIPSSNIDGTPLLFTQPPVANPANFTMFTHFTQTVFLTAGTHTINVLVNDYDAAGSNPTGLDIYGTVSSKGALNSLEPENYPGYFSFVCPSVFSTCNDVLNLTDSLHPCIGDMVTLSATVSGTDSVLSYTWSPSTGLSSSTVLAPVLTASTSGYYYDTLRSLASTNLVVNGDFSCGNASFSSSYTYLPPPSPILLEGQYSVDTDPHDVHSGFSHFGDHTTGTGNMLIVNGGPVPLDVWCQTIAVTPNTDYDFSAWFANASPSGPGTYPIMQFRINGTLIGTPVTVTAAVGVWVNFFSTWNSGANTTANICIYDAQTSAGGNDFVVDDISFRQICTVVDSIYIAVIPPDTLYNHRDTSLCTSAGPLTLTAPPGFLSYLWNTGSTATTISVSTSGSSWVYNTAACSKTTIDTFNVTYISNPTVNLGNDTSFCVGNLLILSSAEPAGYTFLWSTGDTAGSIGVTATGTYWLTVDNQGCTNADTIHVMVSPFPVVDLGADYLNCKGRPDTLQSSVSYIAPTYLWSDASTTPSLMATATGKYWLQVTVNNCSGADTTNVTILWDTLNFYNHDTAICRGGVVPAYAIGDPGQKYQWIPTAGILASTISSPVIIPDTSALYELITSMDKCPDIIDSFYIDVQPNPVVYIGDNRMVCQYDTLRIYASVMPQWYSHYIYSWSPAVSLDNSNSNAIVFTAGDYTKLMLTVTTPAGCQGNDSAELTVHPGNFAKLDTTFDICPGDSVQFIPVGGVKYQWHPGIYLDDSMGSAPWVKAITTQHYTALATSSFGCKDTLHASVNVHPDGVIFLGDDAVIFPGESYQLSPKTNCVNFSWFPHAGLSNAFISNPIAAPEVSTKYIVNAMNEWGCKVSDSINITVDPETLLAVPNAFTPGTGINSHFTIIKRGTATLNYFRIFNRWGNKVFETANIDAGWDGTYNGAPQPFDVYIYDIEAVSNTGNVFHKHGNVTLIR